MTKLNKAKSERTLREDGVWMYHGDVSPKEVDNSPDYFNNVVSDLIDPEKYFSAPLTSGVGIRFALILGDPLRAHHVGEFVVDGMVKKTSEKGVPEYHLLWSKIGKWRYNDIEDRTARHISGEDKPEAKAAE
jgi:hypothetical protein